MCGQLFLFILFYFLITCSAIFSELLRDVPELFSLVLELFDLVPELSEHPSCIGIVTKKVKRSSVVSCYPPLQDNHEEAPMKCLPTVCRYYLVRQKAYGWPTHAIQ